MRDEIEKLFEILEAFWRTLNELEKRIADGTQPARGALGAAGMLEIKFDRGRYASVSINHDRPFPMCVSLARLLAVLAADGERCQDGTVPWKPIDAILSSLLRKGPVTKETLFQLKYRLRRELNRRGYTADLVQFDRKKKAMRFNWRPPETGSGV